MQATNEEAGEDSLVDVSDHSFTDLREDKKYVVRMPLLSNSYDDDNEEEAGEDSLLEIADNSFTDLGEKDRKSNSYIFHLR